MYRIFLKPLKTIFIVIGIMVLGVFADLATLTQFNIIDWFKDYLPWSLVGALLIILVLYISLLIYYWSSSSNNDSTKDIKGTENVEQNIKVKKMKDSTIMMAGRDVNENRRES
ncbi:hypothetical protein [Bacillus cereus]|uniref:hypothetical protein n=1 Tax=Bacillus cereus TaxID=1396 RepID=UPI00027C0FF4|nr:hypothetical protein [Bacillus cereus]EJV56396.1 hypothetical protein IEM_05278 [Bacillus cereus BAG6O-2]